MTLIHYLYKRYLFDKVGQVTQEKKLICRKSLGVFKVRCIDLINENESQMNIYAFYITT